MYPNIRQEEIKRQMIDRIALINNLVAAEDCGLATYFDASTSTTATPRAVVTI
jgi:hypothetical protein